MTDFSSLGISQNSLPKLKKYFEGKLLIVGGGRCVWDDLQRISVNNYDIMCMNDIIMHLPYRINHVYSNDDKMLTNWVAARRPRYKKDFEENILKHTCQTGNCIVWPFPGHGSSGLNACYTGLALGYTEIVLAGVPLDDSGHYFDPPWVKTNFVKEVGMRDGEIKFWANAKRNIFNGKVRSLSGRTKELLGDLS